MSLSQIEENLNKAGAHSPGILPSSAMKTQALINWIWNCLSGNICMLQKACSFCRIFCAFLWDGCRKAGLAVLLYFNHLCSNTGQYYCIIQPADKKRLNFIQQLYIKAPNQSTELGWPPMNLCWMTQKQDAARLWPRWILRKGKFWIFCLTEFSRGCWPRATPHKKKN